MPAVALLTGTEQGVEGDEAGSGLAAEGIFEQGEAFVPLLASLAGADH